MFFFVFIKEVTGFKKSKNAVEELVITSVVLLLLLSVGWMVLDTVDLDVPIIGGSENLFLLIGIVVIIAIFSSAFKLSEAYGVAAQRVAEKQG